MNENIMFPGRENYTGPKTGCFSFLHHREVCEMSDNVMERVQYVGVTKPMNEIAIRLHNMMYLDPVMCPAVINYKLQYAAFKNHIHSLDVRFLDESGRAQNTKAIDLLWDTYVENWNTCNKDFHDEIKPLELEILTYIRSHIPDCAWWEKDRSLIFPLRSEILDGLEIIHPVLGLN